MVDTILARGRLRQNLKLMLLSFMELMVTLMLVLDMLVMDTLMLVLLPPMLLLDMLLPTPVLELSTLPMSECALTTLVLRFLANQKHETHESVTLVSQVIMAGRYCGDTSMLAVLMKQISHHCL